MTITNNVSLLAQTTSQSARLTELRATLDDLQRQATTQKKHDTFSGYGTDSLNLQLLYTTQTMTQGYLDNITTATSRMSTMSNGMAQISKLANELVSAIGTGDITDMTPINQLAQQNLQFVEDILNQQSEGHYLFAGSDTTSQPFVDHNTLNANFVSQINIWLANAAPNADATLTNATDAFTSPQLGLNAGLAASGALTIQIDKTMDLDYTVKADQSCFKDIINSLAFLANLKLPDPAAGDVATAAQFQNVLSHISSVLSTGIQGTNDENHLLAGKFNIAKSAQENHDSVTAILQSQLDKLENVDPSTAIISLQALQTQLTASYQVTKIVSQMSLTNFM